MSRVKMELEIDEKYDDGFKNAPEFRILRGRFPDDLDGSQFNKISNSIRDNIFQVIDILLGKITSDKSKVLEKLALLTEKQQKSLVIKARKVALFITNKKNSYRFTDLVKQVNINLLYGHEIGRQIRYSRDDNVYCKNGAYAKMRLDYNVFLFIIDAMYLLNIIDNQIGNFIHEIDSGYRSRMTQTDYGKDLFNDFTGSATFDDLTDRDLIIMTKKVPKVITKGKNEGKTKYFTQVVHYKDSVSIHKKKNFIKKINNIYKEQSIVVNANNITLKYIGFLDDLYLYIKNNHIELYNIECDIVDKISLISKQSIKYNNLYKDIIREEEKGEDIILWLLRISEGIDNNIDNIEVRSDNYKKNENDMLVIKNIHFKINKTDMFRVYSRNNWKRHGRWYGGLQINLPKQLRKHIYLNDNTEPLFSLDFSAMHGLLAYHLKKIPYSHDPYVIDGFGIDYRAWFKIVSLVSLNADDWKSAVWAIVDKLKDKGLANLKYAEANNILHAFKKHHPDISSEICGDFGIRAMYWDALIIEDCLRELMVKKGIVVLPEHDELLCSPDKVKEVKDQMILSYRKVLRRALIDNGKLDKNDPLPDDLQPVIK